MRIAPAMTEMALNIQTEAPFALATRVDPRTGYSEN